MRQRDCLRQAVELSAAELADAESSATVAAVHAEVAMHAGFAYGLGKMPRRRARG